MGPLLVFVLSWFQLQSITQSALIGYTANNALSESINSKNNNNNNINTETMDDIDLDALMMLPPELNDDINANTIGGTDEPELPVVYSNYDETEVVFPHRPITSVNIDYAHNSVVLKFRKGTPEQQRHRQQQQLTDRQLQLLREAEEQRRALEKNFMRFGRSSSASTPTAAAAMDFMRFGKRQVEQLPLTAADLDEAGDDGDFGARTGRGYHNGGSGNGLRDSRGDNFMRFGRASSDFMRFGRRDPGRDYMRFGRAAPSQDFMRFGRSRSDNFMRLGRSGKSGARSMLHSTGTGADVNFMRFGRYFGPPERDQSENFMRLGKSDQNFMRFGKKSLSDYNNNNSNDDNKDNHTKEAQQQKQELRATAKLLHQTQKTGDENPMDKAIQVLFSKQKQQQQQQQHNKHKQPTGHGFTTAPSSSSSSTSSSSEEFMDGNGNAIRLESELDMSDYAFN